MLSKGSGGLLRDQRGTGGCLNSKRTGSGPDALSLDPAIPSSHEAGSRGKPREAVGTKAPHAQELDGKSRRRVERMVVFCLSFAMGV